MMTYYVSDTAINKLILPWIVFILIPSFAIDIFLVIKAVRKEYSTIVFVAYLVINIILYKLLVLSGYMYFWGFLHKSYVQIYEQGLTYNERLIDAPELYAEKYDCVRREFTPETVSNVEIKKGKLVIEGEIHVTYYLENGNAVYSKSVEKMVIPHYLSNMKSIYDKATEMKKSEYE